MDPALSAAMHRTWSIGVLACAGLAAQSPDDTAAGRVTSVLRDHDPLRNGHGAAELLGGDAPLDAAILAVAQSAGSEAVVRIRALRLARVLGLTKRLREGKEPHDIAWWLAFDELEHDVPVVVRPFLVSRAFADDASLAAAREALRAADDVVRRFCRDWNEIRFTGAAAEEHREEYRHYDELEAALARCGAAAVPGLLRILAVPPEMVFGEQHGERSARQQVRAILALSSVTKVPEAIPYFVLHAVGPSLTQSSDAALAAQVFVGQSFGAASMDAGDDKALLAWWAAHRADHDLVLDHLVQHVIAWARADLEDKNSHGFEGVWCAVTDLDRVLGSSTAFPRDSGPEVWRARLDDLERGWLLRERSGPGHHDDRMRLERIVRNDTLERVERIEKELPGAATVEELDSLIKETRPYMPLARQCADLGADMQARFEALRARVEAAYVDALGLRARAELVSAKEGAALATWAIYEDVVRRLREDANDAKDDGKIKTYGDAAKEIFKAINQKVEELFTHEYVVRVKPVDLLAEPGTWEVAAGSDSVKFQCTGKALVMTNEGGANAKTGGIYYKAGRNWRDYVVELEFELDAGAMTFYTRAEVMDTKHVPGFSVGKEKCDVSNIEYGKTMNAVIRAIGGHFNVALDGADVPGKSNEAISINFARKGPVAISIKPGARLTITKFQVQKLR
jgi:hypothetical protein